MIVTHQIIIAASYISTSSVSSSQHYSKHHASTSSTHREINKFATRGITEQSSVLSGTIDVNASPSFSRKNNPPPNRQTAMIKNQRTDR